MNTYETRHARQDVLATHRHRQPYATLVLSGNYREMSVDGLIECSPGTLIIHPSFHAHGDRFHTSSRTINIPLPGYSVFGECRVIRTELREGHEVFRRSPHRLMEIAAEGWAHEPAELPEWCGAFVAALRESDTPITRIAEELGLSAAYASRKIRQVYGMPPVLLRREWRWRDALSALLGSQNPGQAAATGGFADQSHFTRICRQITGESPGRLRRQVKSVQDNAVNGGL